jgi:hypothetical protein
MTVAPRPILFEFVDHALHAPCFSMMPFGGHHAGADNTTEQTVEHSMPLRG